MIGGETLPRDEFCAACGEQRPVVLEQVILGERKRVLGRCSCEVVAAEKERVETANRCIAYVVETVRIASRIPNGLSAAQLVEVASDMRDPIREFIASVRDVGFTGDGLPGEFPVVERARGAVRGVTGLWLVGPKGVGKSYAVCAMLRELRKRYIPGVFVVAPTIAADVRATYGGKARESEASIVERLASVPVLVIDDLDKASASASALEILYRIVNARANDRLPTCYTTNGNPDEVRKHLAGRSGEHTDSADAIVDRMMTAQIVETSGASRRKPAKRVAADGVA